MTIQPLTVRIGYISTQKNKEESALRTRIEKTCTSGCRAHVHVSLPSAFKGIQTRMPSVCHTRQWPQDPSRHC